MKRGNLALENKRDEEATLARHFHSKESYVSIAGHEYLTGILDHAFRRAEIYRQAGGEVQLIIEPGKQRIQQAINIRSAMCQGCERPHPVSWYDSEWDHLNHKQWNRCDCVENGRIVCRAFHQRRHLLRKKEEIAPCPGSCRL